MALSRGSPAPTPGPWSAHPTQIHLPLGLQGLLTPIPSRILEAWSKSPGSSSKSPFPSLCVGSIAGLPSGLHTPSVQPVPLFLSPSAQSCGARVSHLPPGHWLRDLAGYWNWAACSHPPVSAPVGRPSLAPFRSKGRPHFTPDGPPAHTLIPLFSSPQFPAGA